MRPAQIILARSTISDSHLLDPVRKRTAKERRMCVMRYVKPNNYEGFLTNSLRRAA
jgi:hypothetical protein